MITSQLFVTAATVEAIQAVLRIHKAAARVIAYITYLFTVLGTVALGITVLAWPLALAAGWQQITVAVQVPWVRVVATGTCVLLAFVLFLARTSMPAVYGAAEVLLGTTACWMGLGSSPTNRWEAMLAVAAGLYVVVRGMVNLKKPEEMGVKHRYYAA